MTSSKKGRGARPSPPTTTGTALVTRSVVPADLQYGGYRQYLRYDFFHSCAYCTMSESEAQAIRFTIDHYEPRNSRPDLRHEYSNLMYSCDECNIRKGDRCPPLSARLDGYRFFRPDEDIYEEHFRNTGIRLESKSNLGNYSIQTLDLNRLSLRRLREIRKRLANCDELVVAGVLALRKFHIDQLPKNVKGSAVRAIQQAVSVANQIADDIDTLLREYARSPLIDPDPELESRTKKRVAKRIHLQGLYEGSWRAPRKGRS